MGQVIINYSARATEPPATMPTPETRRKERLM